MTKSELRSKLRHRRNALSDDQQTQASEKLTTHFFAHRLHMDAARIGLYWAADGEIDPLPLANALIDLNIECFLPIIDSDGINRLCFGKFSPTTPLRENRFGIKEPDTCEQMSASELDLILMPLVGFDDRGNRIGMGKGFYDRTLSNTGNQSARPKLIGLAHQCQHVERIDADDWDIPLHGILTDSGYHTTANST